MRHLLRQLAKASIWADHETSSLWENDDCPAEILELMRASSGFSVWEVSGNDDIERTVAATSLLRTKIDDYVFVLLNEEELRSFGIRLKTAPGLTLDSEINRNHRDLINLTGNKFMRLAKIITKESEINTIQRDRIITRIREEFNSGRFDRNKFSARSAAGNIELLVNFFRDRTINFS
jgi:hypothetical protein